VSPTKSDKSAQKIRVYELSKQLDMSNKDLMALIQKECGVELKSHSSTIEPDVADKIIALKKGAPAPKPTTAAKPTTAPPKAETPKAPAAKPAATTQFPPPAPPASAVPAPPPRPIIPKAPVPLTPAEQRAQALAQSPSQVPSQAPSQQRPLHPSSAPAASASPTRAPQRPPQAPPPVPPKYQQPVQHQAPPMQPSMPTPNYGGGGYSGGGGHRPSSAPGQHVRPGAQHQFQNRPGQRSGGGGGRSGRGGNRGGYNSPAAAIETPAIVEVQEEKPIISIEKPITVGELAKMLHMRETEIIKHLFMQGKMVTVTQTLDEAYARDIARQLEYEVLEPKKNTLEDEQVVDVLANATEKQDSAGKSKHLQPRPPVISIMGHVDHGKTSLLDAIRESRKNIVDGEAGGITQSIGAYTVEKDGHVISFLDTPGHEAFTSMRMRGAKATDIAILVVAADDGVMPQTLEAINHAKAAQIPIIVAVNKVDKEGADPDKVLTQLSEIGLQPEKWGGDTVTVEVSALQRLGIDDLLEMIVLVAEILNLKADPHVQAEGVVIEAELDKRIGPVATVLVQNGTLRVGQNLLIGAVGGRIRALVNDSGQQVKSVGPSMPAKVLGLDDVPKAGDRFDVVLNDKEFKQKLTTNKQQLREDKFASQAKLISVVTDTDNPDTQQDFNLILKADTQGSLEAVRNAISTLTSDELKVNMIHTGVGTISEADVMLASASRATIIGFNVAEDANANRIVEREGVKIKTFDIIYHLKEAVETMMLGKLSPDTNLVETGSAEVRNLFSIGKKVVAGCMVTKGKLVRNADLKVFRAGKEIHAGKLDMLKRFKDDAKEVAAGYECGASVDGFNDFEEGDIITVFTLEETARTTLN
jgi:translation initiation factor IF-2